MDEKKKKQHPYDKWIKMRHAMRESDISTKTLIQKIADFPQKVLPSTTNPRNSNHTRNFENRRTRFNGTPIPIDTGRN